MIANSQTRITTSRPSDPFLVPSYWIDWQHPAIAEQAARLAHATDNALTTARRSFLFVRDQIRHSWDYRQNPVTCRASDVLLQGTGFCYAKSHLLAALLRANGIAAGLCYQRLPAGKSGAPFNLHGLNAILLPGIGWHRVDARGNKPGIRSEFTPPVEKLAFEVTAADGVDIPGIWAEPWHSVVDALTRYDTVQETALHLPDAVQGSTPADAQWGKRQSPVASSSPINVSYWKPA